MKPEYIMEGSEINTVGGYMVANDYNGSIVYLTEYTEAEDGDRMEEEKRMLTLSEIADEMKKVDGRNHKVRWMERYTYAVQESSNDDWDECEDTFEEAVELANELGCDTIVKVDQLTEGAVQEWHRGEDF